MTEPLPERRLFLHDTVPRLRAYFAVHLIGGDDVRSLKVERFQGRSETPYGRVAQVVFFEDQVTLV